MKKDIHQEQFKVLIKCETCGNEYSFYSTKKDIKADTCSACHPFYTGKATSASKAGRVERFNTRFSKNKENN